MLRCVLLFLLCAAAAACGRTDSSAPTPERADTRVRELADGYVSAFFDQFPEQATYYGVPGRRHDRLSDNSLAALAAWHAREDRWLEDVKAIDPGAVESRPLRGTYAILREALDQERETLQVYQQLLACVEGRSILLEEYAREMIATEELHTGEVDKMLRKPGDIGVFSA